MAEASQTESELLDRAQGGDAEAYGELIRRNQDYIYNAVYHLVGSVPDAEDLAQDVFVKAFKAIDRFRRQSKFSTWLYGIMLNTVRNHWRRKRTIYSLDAGGDEDSPSPDPESDADGPAEMAQRRERVRAVRQAIGRISEDLREILVLRDLQGLTYEELQEALDLPAGTVKSRLYRARAALKDELSGGMAEPSATEL
jgi:RNA polymerase sigma-70 factor (ECF subfamily)